MPRRIGRALLVITTGMAAGFLLGGCGRTPAPTSPDTVRSFTGQLVDHAGERGTLRASARVFDGTFGSDLEIGRGTLSADGRFEFDLDPEVDPRALVDLTSEDAFCEGVRAANPAQGGSVLALELRHDGRRRGRIGLASSKEALDGALAGEQTTGTVMARMYVDAPTTVSGVCDATAVHYDLELEPGWNLVEMAAGAERLTLRTRPSAPEGVEWWLRPRDEAATFAAAGPDQERVLPWLP